MLFGTLALFVFFWLFGPRLEYKVEYPPDLPPDSVAFVNMLEGLAGSRLQTRNHVQVLPNGEQFYEAELAAIRTAQQSICLEAYIFLPGKVTERFLAALSDRARAGVKVHLLIDGLGSLSTRLGHLQPLLDAGGRAAFYHPLRWNTWYRYNNRTHREILTVDGRIGFVGGAGFDDHWLTGKHGQPRWRDTMYRVEGESVAALQGTFVENWLEATGEVLLGSDYFADPQQFEGDCAAMVVGSSPTAGTSTRCRVLFQTLIAAAQKSVYFTTPYFLPDTSIRHELIRAIQRGVEVRVITTGKKTDHMLTRGSSRRLYGPLLRAGVRIYEYEPSMFHAKTMIVDGIWSVVGSTNFDNRSFSWNDEVNLAIFNVEVGAELTRQFARDVQQSRLITLRDWRGRRALERATEWFGWLLERQQ